MNRTLSSARAIRAILVLCLLSGYALGASAWAADAVAMIADLSGKASVTQGSARSAAAILGELPARALLVLEKEARATIVNLRSGEEYQAAGPTQIAIGADGIATGKGVTVARRTSALAGQGIKLEGYGGRAVQAAIVMRGPGAAGLRQTAPIGKTPDGRPELRWAGADANRLMTVELIDEDANRSLVKGEAGGGSFRLPDSVTLEPGRTYTWTLAPAAPAGAGTGALPLATSFTLAEKEEGRRLGAMRPGRDAPFSERLLFAVWLERSGFLGDAALLWNELAAERPQSQALQEKAAR